MNLNDLQSNWETFGRTIPMRSIMWRQQEWESGEFFASGKHDVDRSFAELASVGVTPHGRALDFGCGIGRLSQALAERLDAVVGVDIAASMIELAAGYNRYPDRCSFALNTSGDLSQFDDASFDFVFSLIVLQHVGPDLAKTYVAEFVRLLRPGGSAYFQLPSERAEIRELDPAGMQAGLEVVDPVPDPALGALTVPARSTMQLRVRVQNMSAIPWELDHRVVLGGRWLRPETTSQVDDQGPWSPLGEPVPAGGTVEHMVEAAVPAASGDYVLELDLHQAHQRSFGQHGSSSCRVLFQVEGGFEEPIGPPVEEAGGLGARMEMHGVPRSEVVATVETAGGRVVAAIDDNMAGPDWVSYRYVVEKPASLSPRRRNLFRFKSRRQQPG
jgi:SAM-dependent methyltransferase